MKEKALLQYHKTLSETIRTKESEFIRFIIPLLSGIAIQFIKIEKWLNIDFSILSLLGMLIMLYGAYYVLASAYQYRNLQIGLTKIQCELNILSCLPEKWNILRKEEKENCCFKCSLLPEFYKPHFYAFIIGAIFIAFNYCCNVIHDTYVCCILSVLKSFCFLCLMIIFLILISVLYCCYQKKINKNIFDEKCQFKSCVCIK
jgi:hypothetical protein